MGDPDSDPIALWVVPVGDLGGVARHIVDATTVGVPGWRIMVLAPDGPLVEVCTSAGIPIITAEIGPGHGLRRSITALRTATSELRPAIIHSHLAHADITAAIAFAGRRGPVLVSTEHGISGDPGLYERAAWRASAMARVHSLRLRSFDGVIAVSRSTAEQIRSRWHPPRRLPIEVIPNGIDRPTEASRTAPAQGIHLATLSRLSHEKQLTSTLRAFAEIHRQEPNSTLTVAGEGPDRDALIAACSDLGISRAVAFPGFVDPRELLGRTDVIVQLSAWENCSYTLLDALAAGVGVVATPVGGNPELLPVDALVAGDDPGAIARKVLQQAHHRAQRPALAPDWPTRADMTAAIAGYYERVMR